MIERDSLPSLGAHFYRDGDETMFHFVIDPGNIIGPRPATRADQEKHPETWEAFCVRDGIKPLDRDASGELGGSLPAEPPPPTPKRHTRKGR